MVNNPFILIGLISHKGEFHPQMLQSLDALVSRTKQEGVGVAIKKVFGSIIPKNRNDLCDAMLQADEKWGVHPTHILMIDSDMVFKEDAALELLKFDRDIVSGLAVHRGPPYAPVVKKKAANGDWETYPRPPLQQGRFITDADGVGCAFMLIKRGVIETVKPPWFAMPPLGDAIMGEDIYFCEKAKQAGYDICVDSSLTIGHIVEHVATLDDYFAYKEERERREKEAK